MFVYFMFFVSKLFLFCIFYIHFMKFFSEELSFLYCVPFSLLFSFYAFWR